tara:strand:+ start:163 stop:789 length:627 start_codon:yes stop_codon:yes gene_type:complete
MNFDYDETKSLKFKKRSGIYSNSTGSNTYDPEAEKAVSYRWWVYLMRIKGKLIFNDHSYSNSTAKHQSALRHLLKGKVKIDAIVYQRESLDKGLAIHVPFKNKLLAEFKLKRKGISKKSKDTQLSLLRDAEEQIKLFRKLGATFNQTKIKGLKIEIEKEETERLEHLRNESVKKNEMRKALKPKLQSLKAVNTLEVFGSMNNLNEVKI